MLDVEARMCDQLFDPNMFATIIILPQNSNYSIFVAHDCQGNNNDIGRGKGRGYGNNRPQCQLCSKIGHLLNRYYQRFNANFAGVTNKSPTKTISVNVCETNWTGYDDSEIVSGSSTSHLQFICPLSSS